MKKIITLLLVLVGFSFLVGCESGTKTIYFKDMFSKEVKEIIAYNNTYSEPVEIDIKSDFATIEQKYDMIVFENKSIFNLETKAIMTFDNSEKINSVRLYENYILLEFGYGNPDYGYRVHHLDTGAELLRLEPDAGSISYHFSDNKIVKIEFLSTLTSIKEYHFKDKELIKDSDIQSPPLNEPKALFKNDDYNYYRFESFYSVHKDGNYHDSFILEEEMTPESSIFNLYDGNLLFQIITEVHEQMDNFDFISNEKKYTIKHFLYNVNSKSLKEIKRNIVIQFILPFGKYIESFKNLIVFSKIDSKTKSLLPMKDGIVDSNFKLLKEVKTPVKGPTVLVNEDNYAILNENGIFKFDGVNKVTGQLLFDLNKYTLYYATGAEQFFLQDEAFNIYTYQLETLEFTGNNYIKIDKIINSISPSFLLEDKNNNYYIYSKNGIKRIDGKDPKILGEIIVTKDDTGYNRLYNVFGELIYIDKLGADVSIKTSTFDSKHTILVQLKMGDFYKYLYLEVSLHESTRGLNVLIRN